MSVKFSSLLLVALLFNSCSKAPVVSSSNNEDKTDAYVHNPNAPILNITAAEKEVNEGEYLIYDLNLSSALSNDLVLKVAFSTTEYTADYANPEDYTPSVAYSIDAGATWVSETDNTTLKLSPSSLSYKIRMATIDDATKEVLSERLSLVLSAADASKLNIPTSKLKGVLKDNDVPNESRQFLDLVMSGRMGEDPRRYFMTLKENSGVFVVSEVATKAETKKQKEIIDGDYIKTSTLLTAMKKASPSFASVTRLQLGYTTFATGVGITLGMVSPNTNPGWDMYLDLLQAYQNLPSGGASQSFNANGYLSTTMVHELGHVLTLSDDQLDAACGQESVSVADDSGISCYKQDSYAASFLKSFYDINSSGTISAKGNLKKPDFISQYARYNYIEDLAESFAGYVCLPSEPSASPGKAYIDKLYYYSQKAIPIKTKLRKTVADAGYTLRNNDENNSSARAYIFSSQAHESCVLGLSR